MTTQSSGRSSTKRLWTRPAASEAVRPGYNSLSDLPPPPKMYSALAAISLLSDKNSAMGDGQVASGAVEEVKATCQEPLFLGAGIDHPRMPPCIPKFHSDRHRLEQIQPTTTIRNDLDEPGPLRYAPSQRVHQWMPEASKWRQGFEEHLPRVSIADAMGRRLLEAPDPIGRAGRAIFVLLSDHGFHLGETGQWPLRPLCRRWRRAPRPLQRLSRVVQSSLVSRPRGAQETAVSDAAGGHSEAAWPSRKERQSRWSSVAVCEIKLAENPLD